MPRRMARVDPSGNAKGCSPSCTRFDVKAAHEYGWTAKAATGAGLVVGLNSDVSYAKGNLELPREFLHSCNGVDAVPAIDPANDVHLPVMACFGTVWNLDHASLAQRD